MARGRTWGMTQQEWDDAAVRLRGLLLDAAAVKSTVTYGEVSKRVFGGRFSARSGALMDLLGEVDTAEAAENGTIIASLVVRADTGMPGDGYFAFAASELGADVSNREAYWRGEAERVWAAHAPSTVKGGRT
jgi:hypothetical protein